MKRYTTIMDEPLYNQSKEQTNIVIAQEDTNTILSGSSRRQNYS